MYKSDRSEHQARCSEFAQSSELSRNDANQTLIELFRNLLISIQYDCPPNPHILNLGCGSFNEMAPLQQLFSRMYKVTPFILGIDNDERLRVCVREDTHSEFRVAHAIKASEAHSFTIALIRHPHYSSIASMVSEAHTALAHHGLLISTQYFRAEHESMMASLSKNEGVWDILAHGTTPCRDSFKELYHPQDSHFIFARADHIF